MRARRTGDVITLEDRDAGLHDSVVFPNVARDELGTSSTKGRTRRGNSHVAHRHHVVDLLDPKPVQDVRHERLEAHVLHACNELRRLEVLVRGVASALTKVVHQVSVGA